MAVLLVRSAAPLYFAGYCFQLGERTSAYHTVMSGQFGPATPLLCTRSHERVGKAPSAAQTHRVLPAVQA